MSKCTSKRIRHIVVALGHDVSYDGYSFGHQETME